MAAYKLDSDHTLGSFDNPYHNTNNPVQYSLDHQFEMILSLSPTFVWVLIYLKKSDLGPN